MRELEGAVRKEVIRNAKIITDYEQLISKFMRFHYWKVGRNSQMLSHMPETLTGQEGLQRMGSARRESGVNAPGSSPFSTDWSAIGRLKEVTEAVRHPELHYFMCANCGKTNALIESKVASTQDFDSNDPRKGARISTPTRPTSQDVVFRFSHK